MKVIVCKDDLPDYAKIEGYASIDTETLGLNHKRDRLCVVQVKSKDDCVFLIQVKKDVAPAPNLCKVLADSKIVKLFHYARFDVGILFHTYGVMCQNIYCTKIASRLTRTYSDRHGLREICRQMLGQEISKGEQSSDWGAEQLTDSQQQYASKDVLFLADLKEKFDVLLAREERMDLFQKCCAFLPTRVHIDLAGWTDIDIFAHH